MNCAAVRQSLLNSEWPGQPDERVQGHLNLCPGCRSYQDQLLQLEGLIPCLPVPPSRPPARLLARVRARTRVETPVEPPLITPFSRPRSHGRESGRQKLALATSLAASLAVFTLAWWAWPNQDPLARSRPGTVNSHTTRVANSLLQAKTPEQRITAVSNLAMDLLEQVRQRPDQPQQVASLARDFQRLVQEDLPRLARELPPSSRPLILPPLAARFRLAESEAARLAVEWSRTHAASAHALRQIAQAAYEADQQLRLLAQMA